VVVLFEFLVPELPVTDWITDWAFSRQAGWLLLVVVVFDD
jgi:hypothetical protein